MQFTGENNLYRGGGKDFQKIIVSVLLTRLAMLPVLLLLAEHN
jgi:hypothetical protein